jgi:hypothetical protein
MGVSLSTPSIATLPTSSPAEGVHHGDHFHSVRYMGVYCTPHLHTLQVFSLVSALHTRQHILWHANTHSVDLSSCKCVVYIALLWHRSMALLSQSGTPTSCRTCSALCPAWQLSRFHAKPAPSQTAAICCGVDGCAFLVCWAQRMAFFASSCTRDSPARRAIPCLLI